MATLKARIEGYIGTVASGAETTVMDSALQEALNNYVQLAPVDKARPYLTEITGTDSDTGVAVDGRVFNVLAGQSPDFFVARQVSADIGKQLRNTTNTSIYKSSATFPSYYTHSGKVFSHPDNDDIIVYVFKAPTIASGDSSVSNMPQGCDELAIFYSCQQILSKRLNSLTVTTVGSFPNFDYSTTLDSLLTSYTTLVEGTIGTSADQLNLQKQFSVISKLIENEEDVELAQIKIGQANQYLEGLKTKLQAETQTDNSELQSVVSKFQANLQEFQANQQDLLSQIQYFGNLYSQKLQFLTASNDGAELNRAGS